MANAPSLLALLSGLLLVTGIAPELVNGVYEASKAFVLAFSQSLNHELADKNVRIQVVLPGATATDIWEKGSSLQSLPQTRRNLIRKLSLSSPAKRYAVPGLNTSA